MKIPDGAPSGTSQGTCQCGYARTGLEPGRRCPECGEPRLQRTKWLTEFREAWRSAASRIARAGFVLASLLFGLALLNSAATIYFALWLQTPGYKGSTAGMVMLYPPLIWVLLQVPISLLAGVIVFLGRSTEADAIIRRCSWSLLLLGLVGSFAAIAISFAWLFS